MPRAREFEYDAVLEKAMLLFWKKGYHDTSLQDLVSAMGINRFSLYATFENKETLFQTALDRYQQNVLGTLLAPIEGADAGKAAIYQFFGQFVEYSTQPVGKMGCLICNTAIELSPGNTAATERMQRYLDRLTSAFAGSLRNAQDREEIDATLDPQITAEYLTSSFMGLFVSIKSDLPKDRLARYVQNVLRIL